MSGLPVIGAMMIAAGLFALIRSAQYVEFSKAMGRRFFGTRLAETGKMDLAFARYTGFGQIMVGAMLIASNR